MAACIYNVVKQFGDSEEGKPGVLFPGRGISPFFGTRRMS